MARLEPEKLKIIELQNELVRDCGFYLAGGSGLALRLGHRYSEDLDWFTANEFSTTDLARRLAALPTAATKVEEQGPSTNL
jgi:hypothetical protein